MVILPMNVKGKIMLRPFLLFLILIAWQFSFSQKTVEPFNDASSSAPTATVSYKTKPRVSLLIRQVRELTQQDESLTERVIYKINNDNNQSIRRIVADAEYLNLSESQKKEAIKQSDVLVIIEKMKNSSK